MIKNYLACLFGFFVSSFVLAQEIDTRKLDLYFKSLEDNNKFMGSVAISQNGKIVYTKTIGLAAVENNLKANENSKYRIGSISKTFTAVLILKAVENKKLALDQTIEKFFPTLANANRITIKQLLGHRSGIHDFTDDEDYEIWNTKARTEKEMVAVITKGGSDFVPDTEAAYSNSNYVLLTYILEKTFKKPYAELLTSNITKPLGLTNTYLGGKINTAKNECRSYRFEAGWQAEPETDISIPLGAGGIVSTPTDLVKFSNALFGGKLLKAENLELMKMVKDNYGLGLFKIPFYENISYGHRGGIDKFTAVFSHSSEGNIAIALISNGSNYNNNEIPLAILSAVYNKPFELPEFKTYAVRSEDLNQYLGTYASSQIPVKITISKDNKTLIAQPGEQSPYPLEATEKDTFKYYKTGITLEFNPAENTVILKQGGKEFVFTKA